MGLVVPNECYYIAHDGDAPYLYDLNFVAAIDAPNELKSNYLL